MQACEPLGVVGFERHSIIFDDPRTRLHAHRRADVADLLRHRRAGGEDGTDRPRHAPPRPRRDRRGLRPDPGGHALRRRPTRRSASGSSRPSPTRRSLYHERVFGSLDPDDRGRYWAEYRRVGELLGLPADSMPADRRRPPRLHRRAASPTAASGSTRSAARRPRDAPLAALQRPAARRGHADPRDDQADLGRHAAARDPPLLGFSWDPAREALLRSALLQLRLGSRFWPEAVRLHPAARHEAGEHYGALAA